MKRHLIIGHGRLARHWQYYLTQLGLHVQSWSRRDNPTQNLLPQLLINSDYAWVLISDSSIEEFIQTTPFKGQWLHCSGALMLPNTWDVHPLMSFSENLYDLELYKKIPLITSQPESLPFLNSIFKNPVRLISESQKPLYHSLCVLMGNGLQVLIKSCLSDISRLHLQPDDFLMLLQKSVENILVQGPHTQTGPWVREDHTTISHHLNSLKDSSLKDLYEALHKQHLKNKEAHL